jgi:hypothetical protein
LVPQLGISHALWINFDVAILQNPLPYLTALAESADADLLVREEFFSRVLTTSFLFVRNAAGQRALQFCKTMLHWHINYPYAVEKVRT